MAKRYSITAGRMVDVPDTPKPAAPAEKPDPQARIAELERDLAVVRSQLDAMTLERDRAAAQLAAAQKALTDASEAHQAALTAAGADYARRLTEIAVRPAPVVAPPAPQPPTAYKVRVTQRDGNGRLAEATFEPQKPLPV